MNDYLKDQLGGKQAKSVLEDADIDYDKDSNATISDKVLKSALIQFANQKIKIHHKRFVQVVHSLALIPQKL